MMRSPTWLAAFLCLLLMVLVANVAVAQKKAPQPQPMALFSKGLAAFQKQDYKEAGHWFEQLADVDPRNAAGLYYLGVCEANLGKSAAALDHLQRAIACGFKGGEKLLEDPLLEKARRSDDFRVGLEKLVKRLQDRQQGIVGPLEFHFDLLDAEGKHHRDTDYHGKVVVVVFMDSHSAKSLEAAFRIERMLASFHDAPAVALGVVNLHGKGADDRAAELGGLAARSGIHFTLLELKQKVADQLAPFRTYPTVLILDAQGNPRSIVEGLPADVQDRYQRFLTAAAKPPAKSDANGKQEKKPGS